jgi:hypothetical protein
MNLVRTTEVGRWKQVRTPFCNKASFILQSLSENSLGAKPDDAKAEIKDPKLIFDLIWRQLEAKIGMSVLAKIACQACHIRHLHL